MNEPPTAAVRRESVSARHSIMTFDETELLFEGADLEHVRLSAGHKDELETLRADIPGVALEVGRHSWRVTTRGSTSDAHTSFVIDQNPSHSRLVSDMVAGSHMHAFGPNTELVGTNSAGTLYQVLLIGTEELDAAARILGRDRGSLGAGHTLGYSGPSTDRIHGLISSFTRTMYQAGSNGVDISVANRFRDEVLMSALSIIGTNNSGNGQLRMSRHKSLQIVIASDDYASGQRYQAITSLGLSREAFASERRLRHAFREIVGIPPMRFMRLRALNEIRAEFRTGRSSSVADVAFEWGFTELGRFAAAYRTLFGELPSETLRSSRRHPERAQERSS